MVSKSTELRLDSEHLAEAAARLRPGSKAYDVTALSGRIQLNADRALGRAALGVVTELFELLLANGRHATFTQVEALMYRHFDAVQSALSTAPHPAGVALRAEAERVDDKGRPLYSAAARANLYAAAGRYGAALLPQDDDEAVAA